MTDKLLSPEAEAKILATLEEAASVHDGGPGIAEALTLLRSLPEAPDAFVAVGSSLPVNGPTPAQAEAERLQSIAPDARLREAAQDDFETYVKKHMRSVPLDYQPLEHGNGARAYMFADADDAWRLWQAAATQPQPTNKEQPRYEQKEL